MPNIFNEYFTNIAKGLNLPESTGNISFENKKSRENPKENFGSEHFSLENFSQKNVLNLSKELSGNKATVSIDFPVSLLKKSISAYYEK